MEMRSRKTTLNRYTSELLYLTLFLPEGVDANPSPLYMIFKEKNQFEVALGSTKASKFDRF